MMILLSLVAVPTAIAQETETATFSMYCYWTGEATVGTVDGVLQTKIGHIPGNEIVEVTWDSSRTSLDELVAALKRQRSFYAVVVADDAAARRAAEVVKQDEIHRTNRNPHFIESKYTLRTRYPKIWELGLSEQQAIALNSWAFFGGKMPDILTADQKSRLACRK